MRPGSEGVAWRGSMQWPMRGPAPMRAPMQPPPARHPPHSAAVQLPGAPHGERLQQGGAQAPVPVADQQGAPVAVEAGQVHGRQGGGQQAQPARQPAACSNTRLPPPRRATRSPWWWPASPTTCACTRCPSCAWWPCASRRRRVPALCRWGHACVHAGEGAQRMHAARQPTGSRSPWCPRMLLGQPELRPLLAALTQWHSLPPSQCSQQWPELRVGRAETHARSRTIRAHMLQMKGAAYQGCAAVHRPAAPIRGPLHLKQ